MWTWWWLVTLISVIGNYLFLDIFEAQYCVILFGERLSLIEEEINKLAGKRILIWETSGSPWFFGKSYLLKGIQKGIVHPDYVLAFYMGLLVLVVTVIAPAYAYYLICKSSEGQKYLYIEYASWAGFLLSLLATGFSGYIAYGIFLRMRGKVRIKLLSFLAEKLAN